MNKKSFLSGLFVLAIWLVFANLYYASFVDSSGNKDDNTKKTTETRVLQKSTKSEQKQDTPTASPSKQKETLSTEKLDFVDYNITVYKNKASVLMNNANIDSIVKHLEHNFDQMLLATIALDSLEKDSIALNRGLNFKAKLIERGIEDKRIQTKIVKTPNLFKANTSYNKGVKIAYERMKDEEIRQREKAIEHNTVYVYYISDSIVVARNSLHYFNALKSYLKKYPNKNIRLVGHTDSVGDPNTNESRGLQRAKIAAQYLQNKENIPQEKIITQSKGEQEPLVSNGTEQGRRANRRIEVFVK